MATSQGIITQVFPSKRLGITGTFVALGSMSVATLGGFIVGVISCNL